jgi:hypothetical protein
MTHPPTTKTLYRILAPYLALLQYSAPLATTGIDYYLCHRRFVDFFDLVQTGAAEISL